MNLTDLFPTTEAYHKATHGPTNKDDAIKRVARLKPIGDAIFNCIRDCGAHSDNPIFEYEMLFAYVCLLDHAIEDATKGSKQ